MTDTVKFDISKLNIRNERPEDYSAVEEMARDAFYNIFENGCVEDYLIHTMRSHEDFIQELALVATYEDKIVGYIAFTKSCLLDKQNPYHNQPPFKFRIVTAGPLCVHPQYQKQGIGKALLHTAENKAQQLGYIAIFLMGNPYYYMHRGYKKAMDYEIEVKGKIPSALMVKPLPPYRDVANFDNILEPEEIKNDPPARTLYNIENIEDKDDYEDKLGSFAGSLEYIESKVMNVKPEDALAYRKELGFVEYEPTEEQLAKQELFYILSRAYTMPVQKYVFLKI